MSGVKVLLFFGVRVSSWAAVGLPVFVAMDELRYTQNTSRQLLGMKRARQRWREDCDYGD